MGKGRVETYDREREAVQVDVDNVRGVLHVRRTVRKEKNVRGVVPRNMSRQEHRISSTSRER